MQMYCVRIQRGPDP